MREVTIRNATSSDIALLVSLDHSFSTDHVWQMSHKHQAEHIDVAFHEIRLPRPMRVNYPRNPEKLIDEWILRSAMWIAERNGTPFGYLAVQDGPAPNSAWITDLVVSLPERRQGVGTQLLRVAGDWGRARGLNRIFMEMQSKNFPVIQMVRRAGLTFSGYNDSFYPDQDIALIFSLALR
jgi:GNAT superfamily N-acetyltransferase